nr:LTA synthase family protein [Deltaproteobacteria bacterium]
MRPSIVPKTIRFLVLSVMVNLLFFTALRIAFWLVFDDPNDSLPSEFLHKSFYLGLKFDLRLALLIHLPLLLFAWMKPVALFSTAKGNKLWSGYLCTANALIFFMYFVDLAHYGYLEERMDATVLSFLYNPLISFQMVMESYAVFLFLMILAVLVMLYAFLIKRALLMLGQGVAVAQPTWKKTIIASLTVVLVAAGIYGKLSYYPLRWSDAFYSNHSFASALALNPVLYFLSSLKNRTVTYDLSEVRSHYDLVASYLGIQNPDKERLSYVRCSNGAAKDSKRPNVLIILLESFAYYKSSVSGNPLDPTPCINEVAKNGLFFDRYYVPHGGTAKSIFALLTGIPDVEPVSTSSRNPLVVRQHTIVNAFEDHEKFYFLGGSLNWAEIRGLLSHNIPGIHIYEEGCYSAPRVDTWGISDLHLLEETNRVLREGNSAPFFAVVQTSGNHRPYTIPDDSRGFQCREISEDEATKYGFESVAGYNSIRFMDHSVKVFLEAARNEPYFNNTIFVFVGDHGSGRRHPVHMPQSEDQLELTRFHVPLVMYAPGLIPEGKTYSTLASEMDVLPTVADLAGIRYVNSTLGRNLLDTRFDGQRYAFTVTSSGSTIGLISDKYYFLMNADGTNKRLHDIYSDTPRDNVIGACPDVAAAMEPLCRGINETANYIRYHNTPEIVTHMLNAAAYYH